MITLSVVSLNGWLQTSRGLIGAKKPIAVQFHTRWGIHTFGVQFPIDILILDTNLQVMKLQHRLPPNRLFFWTPVYSHVIELPPGDIQKHGIQRGDHIQIQTINSG